MGDVPRRFGGHDMQLTTGLGYQFSSRTAVFGRVPFPVEKGRWFLGPFSRHILLISRTLVPVRSVNAKRPGSRKIQILASFCRCLPLVQTSRGVSVRQVARRLLLGK